MSATIKSATAKLKIIKLTRDRLCRFDLNKVTTTEMLPPPAIINSIQYAIITGIVDSV